MSKEKHVSRTALMNEQELINLATKAATIQDLKNTNWIESLMEAQELLFPEKKRYAQSRISKLAIKLKSKVDERKVMADLTIIRASPNSVAAMALLEPVITVPAISKPLVLEPTVVPSPKLDSIPDVVVDEPTNKVVLQVSPGLSNLTFESKVAELVSILAEQFGTQLTTELNAALNTALESAERSFSKKLEDARKITKNIKKQLPRVMVIGVMGEVAFQTDSEYGEMLDLRFYKQEESLNLIRAQAKHCDYVILIVGHINHGHQTAVRDHPGLIHCNGGVTKMKEILLTLACK